MHVAGLDIRTETLAVKRVTGYCPDVGGLVPRATPWEHLQLAARLRRMPDGWEDRARDLLERFDLGGVAHRVTGGFSHGMGRRHVGRSSPPSTSPACCSSTSPSTASTRSASRPPSRSSPTRAPTARAVLVSTHLRELAVAGLPARDRAARRLGGRRRWPPPSIGGEEGAGALPRPPRLSRAPADDLGRGPRSIRRRLGGRWKRRPAAATSAPAARSGRRACATARAVAASGSALGRPGGASTSAGRAAAGVPAGYYRHAAGTC